MRKMIVIVFLVLFSIIPARAQTQNKRAKKLASKVAVAFAYDVIKLDTANLLNGPLKVTIENTGGDVEFEYKSFRNFTAMEKWLKSLVVEPGFPIRSSGDAAIRCHRGLCKLDLIDNQMAHHRVFLTKVYYGFSKNRIYVKKLYLVFG